MKRLLTAILLLGACLATYFLVFRPYAASKEANRTYRKGYEAVAQQLQVIYYREASTFHQYETSDKTKLATWAKELSAAMQPAIKERELNLAALQKLDVPDRYKEFHKIYENNLTTKLTYMKCMVKALDAKDFDKCAALYTKSLQDRMACEHAFGKAWSKLAPEGVGF